MAELHWRTRALAATIHLGGSAVVATLAAAVVFWLWFPNPYQHLAGGLGLFVLITAVDVVMGPLITFAVFSPTKPKTELRRDLAVVVVMQLLALAYGLNTMVQARPVVLALEGDRFRVVSAVDVIEDELPQAPKRLRRLSLTGPVALRTITPTEAKAKLEAIERAINGSDLGTRPKYWREWDDTARGEVMAAAKAPEALISEWPQLKGSIQRDISATGVPAQHVGQLPLLSRFVEGAVLVDTRSGEVIGFAGLHPR